MWATSPEGDKTGELSGLQCRSSKPPPGFGMSYFWMGMRSGARVERTRPSEARRFRTPVASSSSGLSGKASKRPRPSRPSRVVSVALRYESLTATMVNRSSGRSTRKGVGTASKRARKSGARPEVSVMRGTLALVVPDANSRRPARRPRPRTSPMCLASIEAKPFPAIGFGQVVSEENKANQSDAERRDIKSLLGRSGQRRGKGGEEVAIIGTEPGTELLRTPRVPRFRGANFN